MIQITLKTVLIESDWNLKYYKKEINRVKAEY